MKSSSPWKWINRLGTPGLILLAIADMKSSSPWKWTNRLGTPGLILLAIADNAPFMSSPAGSVDLCVILLSAHRHDWWPYYALMATFGEVVGGYLAYVLAAKGGRQTLEKKLGKSQAEKLYQRFEKRGFVTVFTGSILPPPFPFTPVLMTAGVMQYPPKNFLFALIAGRGLRFFTEAFLSRTYGQQMIAFCKRHYRPVLYTLIALGVAAGFAAAVYFAWYRPKIQREERQRGQSVEKFPVPRWHGHNKHGS